MFDKNSFTYDSYTWVLEASGLFFNRKEVAINIDTKVDTEHPDREIFEEQLATLNSIAANWDEIVEKVKKEIVTYENISVEEFQKVADNPSIWFGMDYETNKPWKKNEWNFVVGVTESADFAWHVAFHGSEHYETWAGD